MLDALIAAGTDIFRLNFSHGTHESHGATLRARPRGGGAGAARGGDPPGSRRSEDSHRHCSKAAGRSQLKAGDTLRIATGDFVGGPGRISTTFEGLAQQRAARRSPAARRRAASSCASTPPTAPRSRRRSSKAAMLGEHKGINAPGVPLPASAITPKDVEDLRVRSVARRRHGGAQLRADRRRPAAGAAADDRARRRRRAAGREARAAAGARAPRRDPRRRATR